jgi:hypothetical protein
MKILACKTAIHRPANVGNKRRATEDELRRRGYIDVEM